MDYQAELIKRAREAIKEMPERRDEIIGLYEWAVDEVEGGESEANEYSLFVDAVAQLGQEEE